MPASQYIPAVTPYAFQAYLTADQTLAANLVYSVLNLTTKDFDSNSWFNTGTLRFTPLVAGQWLFNANVAFGTGATTYGGFGRIRKNGASFVEGRTSVISGGTAAGAIVSISCYISMNGTTDFIDLQGGQNAAVVNNAQGGTPRRSWLNGWLIA